MTGVLTINPIGTQQLNTPFTISGTLTYTPTFKYKDDSGSLVNFPSGSSSPDTPAETWTMPHPAITTAGNNTVTVKENVTGLTATSNVFVVQGQTESPNGTVVTASGGQIVEANGTLVTMTPASGGGGPSQAAMNTLANAINAQQVTEVPNGECFSGVCYKQNFLAGDIVIADSPGVQATGVRGTLTDRDGNVWALVAGITDTKYGTPPNWWWGGITLNGADPLNPVGYQGYFIAIRKLNDGSVWVQEAKQGGWWSLTAAQENPPDLANFTRPVPGGTNGGGPDPGPGPNNVTTSSQIAFNGTPDVTTANVVKLVYWNHLVYQHDSVLNGWWSGTAAGGWSNQIAVAASGTTITDATGVIVDGSNNLVTLQGGQVYWNGVVDTTTANVTTVLYYNGVIYQQNASGGWWGGTAGNWGNQLSGDPRTIISSGAFQIANGQIISPAGTVWRGNGIVVAADDQGWFRGLVTAITDFTNCTPLLSVFPKTKYVRIACYDILGAAANPASIDNYVAALTNKGIVCSIEYHLTSMTTPKGSTSPTLSQVTAWYAAWAAHYKNNPYVWFEIPNEINPYSDGDGGAAYFACIQGVVNAIRGAGNNTIISIMQLTGTITGGLFGAISGNSWWGQQHNLVNNGHFYSQGPGYAGYFGGSTQADGYTWMAEQVATFKGAMTTADGTNLPVINGEYGNSTDGGNIDPQWQIVVTAGTNLTNSPGLSGASAWYWNNQGAGGAGQDGDALLNAPNYDGSSGLTAYGQTVHDNML